MCVLQACAAYAFITIPSLSGIFSQLNLYMVSAQVAMLNQCLSQGNITLIFCELSLVTEFGPGWDSNSQPSDLWANH